MPATKPAPRSPPWTAEEDAILIAMRKDGRKWADILPKLPGRFKIAARKRSDALGCTQELLAKRWNKEDSEALAQAVLPYEGLHVDWKAIAELLPGKTPIECSEQWLRVRKGFNAIIGKPVPPDEEPKPM